MFKALNIEVNVSELDSLVGTQLNRKFSEKKKYVSLEECEDMKSKLLKRMEERYGGSIFDLVSPF